MADSQLRDLVEMCYESVITRIGTATPSAPNRITLRLRRTCMENNVRPRKTAKCQFASETRLPCSLSLSLSLSRISYLVPLIARDFN